MQRIIRPSHQAEALERLAALTRQGTPAHTYYVGDQVTILADSTGAHRWETAIGKGIELRDGTVMPVQILAVETLEVSA